MDHSTPLVLAILDGWGLAPHSPHNAITNAKTPTIDRLMAEYPWTTIEASGEAIGLTPGHQGSTEMGHLIISAGRNVVLPQMRVTLLRTQKLPAQHSTLWACFQTLACILMTHCVMH